MPKRKLTDQFIKIYVHDGPNKIITFYDIIVIGLILEISITGRRTFINAIDSTAKLELNALVMPPPYQSKKPAKWLKKYNMILTLA